MRGDVRTDLHECDPQRFDTHGLSRTYARLRGAQQYREVYDVLHPRQQQEQVRLLRRTPFHPRQVELGAHNFESAGWERPQWFAANADLDPGDILPRHAWPAQDWSPIAAAEHRACRERVGLFDLTPFTKVEVHGPGALRSCPSSPPTTSTARSARSSTPRCARRAAGSCATSRSRAPARTASSSSPAARSAATTSRG